MNNSLLLDQFPEPGNKLQKFCGDTITFELTLNKPLRGHAWVRTNIGHADITRQEIIFRVEHNETPLKKDWFDIPMTRGDDNRFRLTLPLTEVGHFEAKCLFIEDTATDPVWPKGDNTTINVQPADICCANIIYNVFVRQFGKNQYPDPAQPADQKCIETLDKKGYTVIPPSGTFRDVIRELDFIMGELGCRLIQLLPINPTPTTFGRMGRFGSPYAALDFTAVDTALVEFDHKTTPLEQFGELVDAVHRRNGKIILDMAVNHTGWGAQIHETHPEWLVRDTEGRIENPGAWGITWEDLTKLDYSHKDLWLYISEIFLTWCQRGADGFRCDAGYMIPVAAWTYIISKVRSQFPDTLFLLEGLGGKISVCKDLLNLANFNWAYSELFQNYDRHQIEHYLPETIEISTRDGVLIHFAETHDNPRLAAKSASYAKLRTGLCALSSVNGGFGFANGVEWLATEKIVVHEAHSLNWGSSENIVAHIRKLNILLRQHPAFHDHTQLKMIQTGKGNYIALVRSHSGSGKTLLVLVNLDDTSPVLCQWKPEPGFEETELTDLLTGIKFIVLHEKQCHACWLEAGQVLCLTNTFDDMKLVENGKQNLLDTPVRIQFQHHRLMVLEILCYFNSQPDLDTFDIDEEVRRFIKSPEEFIYSLNKQTNPLSKEPLIVYWDRPQDLKRWVMIPAGHLLMIRSDSPFSFQIEKNNAVLFQNNGFSIKNDFYVAVFVPRSDPAIHGICRIKITVYTKQKTRHESGKLLFLSHPDGNRTIQNSLSRSDIYSQTLTTLQTNGRGGMLHAHVSWGKLTSRYDALLAANLNPDYPVDRWMMFTRCRAWIVYQGYSYEINETCLDRFVIDDNGLSVWQFHVPVGRGRHIELNITARLVPNENRLDLIFYRHTLEYIPQRLDDKKIVRLILRPDIEDRSFHETTKAYTGPEDHWPQTIQSDSVGFSFSPSCSRDLKMEISSGEFTFEPEWHYMVYREMEDQRGLDPNSDLFSPGYFSALLKGGESTQLTAAGFEDKDSPFTTAHTQHPFSGIPISSKSRPVHEVLESSMNRFVVKRDAYDTVIAGYPWFLDWGRDTLIFTRGLIAAKQYDRVKSILKQFGKFEYRGTLPNMIRGENSDNRDTSDAPLWFCVACADLCKAEGHTGFLKESCGERTLYQVILSIGKAYATRTPNGIHMDPASGLIYSPSHFTWMDTNHPAGTPREGYPIEIQALWFKTVQLLAAIDSKEKTAFWKNLAKKIRNSILRLFQSNSTGYLSDCLHAFQDQPAQAAQPDDALRPNQLLAITLGAVADNATRTNIITACQSLLVPGAIRSLADQNTKHPLAIYHNHQLLNNPDFPYWGRYEGDEDTRRKPAYHNGTAWTWLFPSFSEAYAMVYGETAKPAALSILSSSFGILNSGCVGHIPEILDGDYPHTQRGCDAQAWGASELYRVWKKLM